MDQTQARTVTQAVMSELVASGQAIRLLPEFEVVPTYVDGRWWYVEEETSGDDYVPASPDLSAHYDQWRAEVVELDTLVETYEAEIRAAAGRQA